MNDYVIEDETKPSIGLHFLSQFLSKFHTRREELLKFGLLSQPENRIRIRIVMRCVEVIV